MRRMIVASLAAVSLLNDGAFGLIVAGCRLQHRVPGAGADLFPTRTCNEGAPGSSPFAKGRSARIDFIQFSELEKGSLSEESFPRFVEVYQLDKDFDCDGRPVAKEDAACKEFSSRGLPNTLPDGQGTSFSRDRRPLYMVRITDETVANKNKKYFVFPLSIHGIERAWRAGPGRRKTLPRGELARPRRPRTTSTAGAKTTRRRTHCWRPRPTGL